ncbi:Probable cytochrome P450 4s3 [Sergentomyia squamirostris]
MLLLLFLLPLLFVLTFKANNIFTKCRKFKRILDFSYKVPGPSITELIRKKGKIDYLPWILACREKYRKSFAAWFGKELILFLTTPDDVKDILSNPNVLQKSKVYELMQPWLGQGLLTSSGAKWIKNRKVLTPAFHFNILKLYQKSMEECSDILVKKLSEVADERPVDIQAYSTLFALDVIYETAMGVRMNFQENDNAEYIKSTRTICEIMFTRAFSPFLKIPLFFNMSSSRKRQDEALHMIHGQSRRVLELRRKKLSDDKITMDDILGKDDNGIGRMKGKLAFLDLLLLSQREGNDLTDENIREEVDTFMFEGHDTLSSALAFAIYELSQHTDIQEQVYQEAVEFEGHESECMKYLEAVIKETLRLYPSVPSFARLTTENTKIGDLIVPPGVNMSISAYALHRNPEIFTDPDTFNPERFINGTDIPNYAYVPFSAGPRNCIGQKFAMIELKVTLAKILRHLKLIPVSGYEPILSSFVTLKSVNGLQVGFKKRC